MDPPGADYNEERTFKERDRESRYRTSRESSSSRYDRKYDYASDRSYSRMDDDDYEDSRRSRYRVREDSSYRRGDDSDDRRNRRSYSDYGKGRDYERGRYSDRDNENRGEHPNDTIMIRGLALTVTEETIVAELAKWNLTAKDIRVVKRRESDFRKIAFVQFESTSEASHWKKISGSSVVLEGNQSFLHYSLRESVDPRPGQDWTCHNCSFYNFGRRTYCFKCNEPTDDSIAIPSADSTDEVSSIPSATLMLRDLDVIITEEKVLASLGQVTNLPIKGLKIPKDPVINVSLGVCIVQLNSIREATQLYDQLVQMGRDFKIEDKPVKISYSRKRSRPTRQANNAESALSAAQWSSQASFNQPYSNYGNYNYGASSTPTVANLGTVTIDGVSYPKYPVPDISTYQFDQTSGYYYDAQTGLYYEPKSKYYYNSATQQYVYWDGEKQTYRPVQAAPAEVSQATLTASSSVKPNSPEVASAPSSEKIVPQTENPSTVSTPSENLTSDQSKKKDKKHPSAQKIAKDMERWAKMQNRKNESVRLSTLSLQQKQEISKPSTASSIDSGFLILQKEAIIPKLKEDLPFKTETLPLPPISDSLSILANYGVEDNTDSIAEEEFNKALDSWNTEVKKLIDLEKLTCLLCKRKFASVDILTKHEKLSDLHKQNLQTLKISKLTPDQIEELEHREQDGSGGVEYRDRAKERRKKFGLPECPVPVRSKTYEKPQETVTYEEPTKFGIGSDNIGNMMLKKMGWSEGQGLGKDNKGNVTNVEATLRSRTAGLGLPGATLPASTETKFNYRENGKKLLYARYKDL